SPSHGGGRRAARRRHDGARAPPPRGAGRAAVGPARRCRSRRLRHRRRDHAARIEVSAERAAPGLRAALRPRHFGAATLIAGAVIVGAATLIGGGGLHRHRDRARIHFRISARVRAPYGGRSTRSQPWSDPGYRTIFLSADPIMPKTASASGRGARQSSRVPTYRKGVETRRTPAGW